MIVRIDDFYFDVDLYPERANQVIKAMLEKHIEEHGELDSETFLELIEEDGDFEAAPNENDCDLDYPLEKLEEMADLITEELNYRNNINIEDEEMESDLQDLDI